MAAGTELKLPEPARTAWLAHRRTIAAIARARHPPGPAVLHGGTILAARWNHRDSEDLDIFLPARSNLTDILPGMPRDIERSTGGQVTHKSARQVVVELDRGVIDISAAAWKLPGDPLTVQVDGQAALALDTAQILHGKLQRAGDPPARDAFDFITAAKLDAEALEHAVNALTDDENAFVQRTLAARNDELAREAPAKLKNIRHGLETPYGTIGIDAARAVRAHQYTRIKIGRTPEGVTIETVTNARPGRPTAYCNRPDAAAVLIETRLDTHLERVGGMDAREIAETLDLAGRTGWTGTVLDSADERPWERTRRAKATMRGSTRSTGSRPPGPGVQKSDPGGWKR